MITALLSLIFAPAILPAFAPAMAPTPAPQEPTFVELFPNGSLEQWEIVGGDGQYEWNAETNELHGWGATRKNTFLLSKKQWSDFELEVELKISAEGNSGVQFRSHTNTEGRVFGYQAEVDPSERSWSGGIYDEGRRGWIASLEENDAGRAAFRKGEWNHYRIKARGPWLRTWVNGVPCADIVDATDLSGHIAFQVHSGGKTDMRWRNAHIRNLGGETEVAADRAQLLEGVSSVPSMGTPGTIAVFGRSAFAVITGGQKNPLAVAAAARFGKGRVFAIAHNSYFSASVFTNAAKKAKANDGSSGKPGTEIADQNGGAAQLMHNAIAWLSPNEKKRSVAFLGQAIAEPAFRTLGFEVSAHVAPQELAPYSLLILSGGVQFSPEEAAAVRNFVANGGSLMAAICPWGWQQVNSHRGWRLPTHLGDNQVLVSMGLCFADGYASGSSYAVSKDAAQQAHAGTALDAMLAGEENVQAFGLELAVSSLPKDDTTFMWPLRNALPEINAGNAPHPNHRLSTKKHALERLAVMLNSRMWSDLPAEEITAAPGADQFPGAVAASAPRESLDLHFDANLLGWQSTGLYLAPGEVLTAKVHGENADGWSIRVGCHADRVWHKDNWQRWPEISKAWPLQNGGTYASPYGGSIFLVPSGSAAELQVQLSGAVKAPLYDRKNPLSAKAWQKEQQAAGPWAELVGNNIALSVPTYAIQDLEDPEALLAYWDELVQSHYEFGAEELPKRPERFVADAQISAGYMHSGYPIMTWLDVVTPREGKLPVLLDLKELRAQGNWGYFHELGHNRQKGDWTFGGTGEVTNNLFSLHGGEVMAGVTPWDNSWLQNQKMAGRRYLADNDSFSVWKRQPGIALLCYAQIQKEFGWDVFHNVFATYRDLPQSERPKNDAEKINQWVLRMSLETGRDLRPFHLKWNWPLSEDLLNNAQLAELKVWMPDFKELE